MTNVKGWGICLVFTLTAAFLTLTGCARVDEQIITDSLSTPLPLPTLTVDNYPHLDGSTSTMPLDMLVLCELMDMTCEWIEWIDGSRFPMPDLTVYEGDFPSIEHHGTHDAYLNLIFGEADLIFVARLPSSEELGAAADF